MPSSKDPVVNRQKAKEYRLAHPDWHRQENREYMRRKRAADPEKNREQSRRWARNMTSEQRAHRKVYMRLWKEAHPDYNRTKLAESYETEAPRHLLQRAKVRAKRMGLPFDLTRHDLSIPAVCPVLGIQISLQAEAFHPNSPSVDRLIPTLGYVRSNVRVISNRANLLKSNATAAELRLIADYIDRETTLAAT
jgi:hypothetical protein